MGELPTGEAESPGESLWQVGRLLSLLPDEILAGSLRNLINNQIGPEMWE